MIDDMGAVKGTTYFELRVKMLENRIGSLDQWTADAALDIALHAEQTAKDVGPFDPAFSKFTMDAYKWFNAAVLIEEYHANKKLAA